MWAGVLVFVLGWFLDGFSRLGGHTPLSLRSRAPFALRKGLLVPVLPLGSGLLRNDVIVGLAAFDFLEGVDDFVGRGSVGDVYSDV